MTITKDEWREQWLLSIYELTDYDYQEKTWLDKFNTNPHFSFTEFMCFYFDDILCDIPYVIYVRDGWVTEKELEIILYWHTKLNMYQSPGNRDSDSGAVLNDPIWKDLVKQGSKTRSSLIEIVSEHEKVILRGNLPGA